VQHEISIAADNGVRQVIEETDGEVTESEKAAAMKSATEKKIAGLRIKMGKLVAVANPDLTQGWLREVLLHSLFFILSNISLFWVSILGIHAYCVCVLID